MNILITGGAGFIGSHLCDKLLQSGNRVICLDNLSTGNTGNLENANKYADSMLFIKGDVNRYDDMKNIFKYHSIEAVYHYSAVVGVKRTKELPFAVLEDIEGIKNVLGLSDEFNVKKLIYASSSEVYGEAAEMPMSEDSYINPGLTYAAVKLIGERYSRAYFERQNLKTCCLRFFNVYGPRQNASSYGFVVGILINKAINNGTMVLYGDGSQTRDFTYITDAVNCSERALHAEHCNGEIINIGTGIRTSISALAAGIIKVTSSKSDIKYGPMRDNDVLNRCAEIKKMSDILKYKMQYCLKDGLERTVKWYKNHC
jgi:UDP-glucuronate decarboxylase